MLDELLSDARERMLKSVESTRDQFGSVRTGRATPAILDRVVEHFGGLQKLLSAGIEELQEVEGVGELRARTVREGLSRLAETSFVDRYV